MKISKLLLWAILGLVLAFSLLVGRGEKPLSAQAEISRFLPVQTQDYAQTNILYSLGDQEAVQPKFQIIAQNDREVLDIFFFYSNTCPHCIKQKPLMQSIDDRHEAVRVHFIEVSENQEKWAEFLQRYKIASAAVPRTFIGDKSFIGYSEDDGPLEYNQVYHGYIGYRNQIINAIETQVATKIYIPGEAEETEMPTSNSWMVFLLPVLYLFSYPLIRQKNEQAKRYWIGGLSCLAIASLFSFIALTPEPVIEGFARSLPFPLFVFTIALADGFNPCAFTVLIILLSLLTYTKSRKDMTIVGSTFIITSAVMYFLFVMLMVLVGSVFLEKYGNIVLWILGTAIAIAGIVNVKDYFFFKKGISLSLSEKQQLAITKRASKIIRDLQQEKTNKTQFFAALGGTVLLAIFVNLVELGCTAILPAVYMTTLVQSCTGVIGLCYTIWTAFYAIIYILPLLAILGNFIYSFKSARLTENQGRILKLIGGAFMIFFGAIMILKPSLLMLG